MEGPDVIFSAFPRRALSGRAALRMLFIGNGGEPGRGAGRDMRESCEGEKPVFHAGTVQSGTLARIAAMAYVRIIPPFNQ